MFKHAATFGISTSFSSITLSDFTRSLHTQANNSWSRLSSSAFCGNLHFAGTWAVLKIDCREFRFPLVHRSLLHSHFWMVFFGPSVELLEGSLHVLTCVWCSQWALWDLRSRSHWHLEPWRLQSSLPLNCFFALTSVSSLTLSLSFGIIFLPFYVTISYSTVSGRPTEHLSAGVFSYLYITK